VSSMSCFCARISVLPKLILMRRLLRGYSDASDEDGGDKIGED